MNQAQAITSQANLEIIPCPHQKVTTMASRLWYFILINPTNFYESKVYEDPEEFIYEVYKIQLAMGLFTSEKT